MKSCDPTSSTCTHWEKTNASAPNVKIFERALFSRTIPGKMENKQTALAETRVGKCTNMKHE